MYLLGWVNFDLIFKEVSDVDIFYAEFDAEFKSVQVVLVRQALARQEWNK